MEKKRREPRKEKLELFYSSIEPLLENLDDKTLGMVFRSIVTYDIYGERKKGKDKLTDYMLNTIYRDLDRTLKKFQDTCKRNKENRDKAKNESIAEQNFKRLTGKG